VLRCSGSGECGQFIAGLGTVLGLKVQGAGVWLLNNSAEESALIHYDLASGKVLGKYAVPGGGHELNDLTIAPSGEIYVTDNRAGAVLVLATGAGHLTRLPGTFLFANGVALSADGRLLYVSTFGDGISVVDLKSHAVNPITHPSDLCLATIDGLYFHRGTLIAVQNAFMAPRVVRFVLKPDLRGIERFEVLERGNPLFDGVTTGVIAGDDFFYMANIQDEKKTDFDPITILRLRL